jgi:hypothetical protein
MRWWREWNRRELSGAGWQQPAVATALDAGAHHRGRHAELGVRRHRDERQLNASLLSLSEVS